MFGGPSREKQIDDQIYNMRFAAKSFFRTATSHKKKEKEYLDRARKSLRKDDERTAATYAKQSTQFANLAANSTNLACNIEVLSEKVNEALKSGRINGDVTKTVLLLTHQIQPALVMNQIGVMDKAFEDILVCTNAVSNAIDDTCATSGQDDVDLLNELKDEISNGESLDLIQSLPSLSGGVETPRGMSPTIKNL
jgi:charged multivesicular body protein 1